MASQFVKQQKLGSVAGTKEPVDFDSTVPPAENDLDPGRLRWMYIVLGILTFGLGFTCSFIGLAPSAKPYKATLYTDFKNTGLNSSSYDAGLGFFVALAVYGAAILLAAAVPAFWDPVQEMMTRHGVNALGAVADVTSAMVVWFGFATLIFVREGTAFALTIFARVVIAIIYYGFASENNKFLLDKRNGGAGAKRTAYYVLLISALLGTLGLWLVAGSYWIDACWFSVLHQTQLQTAMIVITGIVTAIFDLGGWLIMLIRYLRCDTGCFTLDVPYFAVYEVIRHVQIIWVAIHFIVSMFGPYYP